MEEKIEVLNKNYETIAFFSKEDLDNDNKMIDPEITISQNGESFFTFMIKSNCEKWKEIKDPTNLYKVNGRIYSPLCENSYIRSIPENGSDITAVRADEIWNLLSRKYVRAWNSETGFETIDDFMVVIVSGGNLELKNDDNFVNPKHSIGTAGYVLEGLLYGTGWTVEQCTVEGIYDFETDMTNILENIRKVQELWGGILVWDSLNKTVSLQDEEVYENYNGYLAIKGKNIKSLEDVSSNVLVTRLVPLGEAGLNIKAINNDVIYLENYEYTDEIFYEIINNSDIYEQEQLLNWGKRKLKEKSKPQKTLNVNIVDLRQREENKFEKFNINETIDIIYDDIKEKLRITSWTYKVFGIANSTITLSNVVQNSRDIFNKIADSTNAVESGKINSNKVYTRGSKTTVKQQIDNLDSSNSSVVNNIGDGKTVNSKTVIDSINSDTSSSKISAEKIDGAIGGGGKVDDVRVNNVSVLDNNKVANINFSQYETDPTVPQWAKEATKPKYTAQEVGAMPFSDIVDSYWAGTQAEYDALGTYGTKTLYLIKKG